MQYLKQESKLATCLLTVFYFCFCFYYYEYIVHTFIIFPYHSQNNLFINLTFVTKKNHISISLIENVTMLLCQTPSVVETYHDSVPSVSLGLAVVSANHTWSVSQLIHVCNETIDQTCPNFSFQLTIQTETPQFMENK